MTDAERLELACLRAYVRAHNWLAPAAFVRYCRLEHREREAARVAAARALAPPRFPLLTHQPRKESPP